MQNQLLIDKDKIKFTAFQMFRDWTVNAKAQYSEFDFTIIDETVLADLTNIIQSGISSLKIR